MNRLALPPLFPMAHRLWIAFASALLLAGCTVVPEPTNYSYQQTPCPPGVAAGTTVAAPTAPQAMNTAPQAMNTEPPAETPPPAAPPAGQAPDAPLPPAASASPAPARPQVAQTAPAVCYTAVPTQYSYDDYPGYAYAYPYPYPAYYPYPYYAPYYGPTVGIGVGFGHWHHWH